MKMIMKKNIITWAKTTPDGNPGISVLDHCRNVGWVTCLLSQYKNLLSIHSSLDPFEIAGIAAPHDVGKTSKGFSCKCRPWLEKEGLYDKARSERWEDQNSNHGQISQYSIYKALKESGVKKPFCKELPLIAGSHHGKIFKIPDAREIDDWETSRNDLIKKLWQEFAIPTNLSFAKDSPIFPVLMGLTSVSDWIGSDDNFFPSDKSLTREECIAQSKTALRSIGLAPPVINKGLSFHELFSFTPNELQQKAIETITKPGIYTIEAPMGLGKTEAALACTYNLLAQGKASGLYFSLPTQITSNRIHRRVQDFINRIAPNSPDTQLIHGNSWLIRNLYHPDIKEENELDEKHYSQSWFASSKRALLSPFGVGTVDQALLGIVPVKHWFVRRFALAGKVVIIDEVHSYDWYTGTLIKALCDELVNIGCTVILLSATLLPDFRNRFLNYNDQNGINDYPLITGKPFGETVISSVSVKAEEKQPVKVYFKSSEQIMDEAICISLQGARILWVCNTVNQAQTVYSQLRQKIQGKSIDLGLLHSRFPYFQRDHLEEKWLERFAHETSDKTGCILVSTQVVEQSVDIDADLLISELAPMDMLLQRIGRLWRHLQKRPPSIRPMKHPEIWIIEESFDLQYFREATPDQIIKGLGGKAWVYYPYVLLRTLNMLKSLKKYSYLINLPGDIRMLLEETYRPDGDDSESWVKLCDEAFGEDKAKERIAENNSRIWQKIELQDEEGKSTRLVTLATRALVLIRDMNKDCIVLLNGETIPSVFKRFSINDARAIHRNIVKVHDWPFVGQPAVIPFENYVRETHQSALLLNDGTLKLDGLKDGFSYKYDEDLGVYLSSDKGENDESCD